MFYYELSSSQSDGAASFIFMNEKYFSNEEFKKITNEAIRVSLEKLLCEEDKKEDKEKQYIGFCHLKIFDIAIEHLKRYGFERLKITSESNYHYMYIIDDSDVEYFNDNIAELFKGREELLYRIANYNGKVSEI